MCHTYRLGQAPQAPDPRQPVSLAPPPNTIPPTSTYPLFHYTVPPSSLISAITDASASIFCICSGSSFTPATAATHCTPWNRKSGVCITSGNPQPSKLIIIAEHLHPRQKHTAHNATPLLVRALTFFVPLVLQLLYLAQLLLQCPHALLRSITTISLTHTRPRHLRRNSSQQ